MGTPGGGAAHFNGVYGGTCAKFGPGCTNEINE